MASQISRRRIHSSILDAGSGIDLAAGIQAKAGNFWNSRPLFRSILHFRPRYDPPRHPPCHHLAKPSIQLTVATRSGRMSRCRKQSPAYFGLGFRLRLIALQPQRKDSGIPRGVTYNQDSQHSQRKHPRSSLKAATTGSKSFLPKLAHSL